MPLAQAYRNENRNIYALGGYSVSRSLDPTAGVETSASVRTLSLSPVSKVTEVGRRLR